MKRFVALAKENYEFTRVMRRDFHEHPELGFEEIRTSGIIARELESYGLEVRTGVAKTGVVTLIEGDHPGPVVLLRADMDALPVAEENEVEYVSKTPGKMHACGHDAHTAMMLTVAKILNQFKSELHGTLKIVFQPAEEGLGGAELMVKEGVLEDPKPDYSLGMHVWNTAKKGIIVLKEGPLMAGAKTFQVKIIGRGGHGAMPYQTIDPVVAAAQIIMGSQTIVSRNVSAQETAVLSITSVQSGDTFNVIPSEAELKGTIRYFKKEVGEFVQQRLMEIVTNTARAMDCEADFIVEEITPSVSNDAGLIQQLQEITREILPAIRIDTQTTTMGSEDMAFLMDEIPGAFFFLGTAYEDAEKSFPHHHPCFDIDETAMIDGVALMCAMAYKLLQP